MGYNQARLRRLDDARIAPGGEYVLCWMQAYRRLEYALDGRDPNSTTGILWCFGLFDRPWAPERPVLGSVRYMSSENTARKFDLKPYYAYVERLPSISAVRSGLPPGTGAP